MAGLVMETDRAIYTSQLRELSAIANVPFVYSDIVVTNGVPALNGAAAAIASFDTNYALMSKEAEKPRGDLKRAKDALR